MKLSELCPVPLPEADLPLEVTIGRGLKNNVRALAEQWLGANVLYLADQETWAAADLDEPSPFILEGHPHADDETIQIVLDGMGECDGVVAVGSGTINDLAKRACTLANKPYIVLGTAASMNGYASGIAAILSNGLKTTVPARPPRAIILDTDILSKAPPRLTQAGLGDLMSKPVSDSDWWLANELEGTGYSRLPSTIVDHAVHEAIAHAAGLPDGAPDAHGALGTALVLSGVAMVVAGSSSPASGGEHLLSHLWDMENLAAGHPTRLHGAQVGVATCISAAIYQRLLRMKNPNLTAPGPWSEEAERIRVDHGVLAEVILAPAERKYARAESRLSALRDRWSQIRDGLGARQLPTPEEIRKPLAAAGAPHRLVDLDISRSDAARVLRCARDIRDRVTVLDLAFETGVLPGAIDDILDEAGV